mgnify:CR=1
EPRREVDDSTDDSREERRDNSLDDPW